MERTLQLELPSYLPPIELNPNGRASWRVKYEAQVTQRIEMVSALSRLNIWPLSFRHQGTLYDERGFPWEKVVVKFTFYVKDNRRRDKDNFIASMKAGLDALQGRIIKDDKDITLIEAEFIKDKAMSPLTVIEVRRVE